MNRHASKKESELEVFRAFAAAAHLPIASESINQPPEHTNEPDILCSVGGADHYFELSEVFCETPARSGETLAKGLRQSGEAAGLKSRLAAQGKTAEANQIVTGGQSRYPPLLPFKQSLERKTAKSYALRGRPCSLLLYYARQNWFEPYDLLFEYADVLKGLLAGAPFNVEWLYQHSLPNSTSLSLGTSEPAGIAAGQPVPQSQFCTREQVGAVIGRIALQEGRLSMAFDSYFSETFNAAWRKLNAALAATPSSRSGQIIS